MAELDRLVKEFINGNKDSFDLIYEQTKQSVYLSIYAIIKDHSSIDDIMQDTYLKAIDAILSYKIGTNFKAWISRIARNNAINYYNKELRSINLEVEDFDDKFSVDTSTPLIDSALEILDGNEKEIFVYRIILGYKFKDIAKVLDMNLKTAYFQYKKAINKIKEQL